MDFWLEWARGPAFRFAFVVMLLGLARLVVLNVVGIFALVRQAQDKNVPGKTVIQETLRWLFPFSKVPKPQLFFTTASFVFHICIIVVPVFLGAHILLWKRGLGMSWPALDPSWADAMTLVAIVTALILVLRRLSARATRSLSRAQDYLLPAIIAIPFVTGYLAMHPAVNPFDYNATMLVHVMSGNLIFILIPFTKLSHVVLFPTTQVVSEMGWHLVPDSGRRVAVALGKEGEPI
jgi:nitrate reductase gamma subunit